jgi:Condensation domain
MCAAATRVSGPLDIGLLRASIEAVVARHESLRTRVVLKDGAPIQWIDHAGACPLQLVDLAGLSRDSVEAEAARLAKHFVDQSIDLSTGPLFEAQLLRLSHDQHVLIVALDHITADGLSFEILNREVWTLYEHGGEQAAPALPALPIQFADYAAWQAERSAAWRRRHASYWEACLAGAKGVRLPLRALDVTGQPAGAMLHFCFGTQLSGRLAELAWHQRVPLSLVILAIYVAVMSRWCQQRDVLLGFVTHGRDRPELDQMIGSLANYLYLRLQLEPASTFVALLKHIVEQLCTAQRHRDFGRVPDLLPDCATELYFNWIPASPTFRWLPLNCMPNWLPPGSTVTAGGLRSAADRSLRVEPFPLATSWSFKFTTLFYDSPAGVSVAVWYWPELIAEGAVECLMHDLRASAVEFVRHPQAVLACVPMSAAGA